jgi:hypothetical protein
VEAIVGATGVALVLTLPKLLGAMAAALAGETWL